MFYFQRKTSSGEAALEDRLKALEATVHADDSGAEVGTKGEANARAHFHHAAAHKFLQRLNAWLKVHTWRATRMPVITSGLSTRLKIIPHGKIWQILSPSCLAQGLRQLCWRGIRLGR